MCKTENKSFAFIGQAIDFSGKSEIQIGPDYKIKQANESQQRKIKSFLEGKGDVTTHALNFEKMLITTPTENGSNITFEDLPQNQWKYAVLEFNALQPEASMLMALALSSPSVNIIFEHLDHPERGHGYTFNPIIIAVYLVDYSDAFNDVDTVVDINVITPEKILQLYKKINDLEKEKYPEVNLALYKYYNLHSISISSPFVITSMFSIIENLITVNDPEKSINKQLGSKIKLINDYYNQEITFADFVSGCMDVEKITSKLYSLRSSIAHGTEPDFKGDLQMFKNFNNARNLLYCVLKIVIKFALSNPLLTEDLRKC